MWAWAGLARGWGRAGGPPPPAGHVSALAGAEVGLGGVGG